METLQDELQFESFMDWLFREFSSEVMLSVIELVQFKQYLKKYGQRTDVNEIGFFEKMPSSSIVESAQTLELNEVQSSSAGHEQTWSDSHTGWVSVPRIAGALYDKYIRRHSVLEINISATLRNRWHTLHSSDYPQEDLPELSQLVDEVISEMLKYMRQSFLRFDNL